MSAASVPLNDPAAMRLVAIPAPMTIMPIAMKASMPFAVVGIFRVCT